MYDPIYQALGGFPIKIETKISLLISYIQLCYFYNIKIAKLYVISQLIQDSFSIGNPPIVKVKSKGDIFYKVKFGPHKSPLIMLSIVFMNCSFKLSMRQICGHARYIFSSNHGIMTSLLIDIFVAQAMVRQMRDACYVCM